MYEQLLDALRHGRDDEALQAARAAVEDYPDDPRAHRALAAALTALGRREDALFSVDQALALAPEVAALHFQRAALLLDIGDIVAARELLAHGDARRPGLLDAYIVQAQLALGRDDLEDAERLRKLAARLDAGHPRVIAVAALLALRRGQVDAALDLLDGAAADAPDDALVLFALGFACLANDDLACAERAFTRIVVASAQMHGLRQLLAEVLGRQRRYRDGLAVLQPLLSDPRHGLAPVLRLAGELQMAAGDPEAALHLLKHAMRQAPEDRRSLRALLEAWRRLGDVEQARRGVDELLQAHPQGIDLWRARLRLEPAGSAAAMAVAERWLRAVPGNLPALELKMRILDMQGRPERAEAVARAIVDLEPEHPLAELRLVEGMIQRDPRAALHYLQQLREDADAGDDLQRQRLLAMWSARAHDRAGHHAQAAQAWLQLHQQVASQLWPLPEPTAAQGQWPPLAARDDGDGVIFLIGPPGALAEQLAIVLSAAALPAFRGDRLHASPPDDPLQDPRTAVRLRRGQLDGGQVIAAWRARLPARGIRDGRIIDWLPWWDNAYLLALRPHLAGAGLILAIRDPRDMYLDWLARGSPAPLRIENHCAAAAWLAAQLHHIAELEDGALFPHQMVRMDRLAGDAAAQAKRLSQALGLRLPPPPPGALAQAMFAPGHWRAYRRILAEPFALLAPVARRLGYPAR